MIIVFGFLVIALLIKDTVPLGDVYILRALSQGAALMIGLWWLFTQGSVEAVRRYWLLGVYIIVLGGTVFVSNDEMRVILQVMSLFAVSLFFVSFSERAAGDPAQHQWVSRIVISALLVVCIGSLLLYKIAPALAYDHTVERLTWDNVPRFKGLFGKPAEMAAVAGIFFGLCVFTNMNMVIRGVGVVAAVLCLYLTLSRSFWAGALVALVITGVFYIRQKRILVVLGVIGLVLGASMASLVEIKGPAMDQSKVLRSESLENLSGRTVLWSLAITRFWERPLLGYGYTLGHQALLPGHGKDDGKVSAELVSVLQNETFSLHSGYVQALVDSGMLGTLFYVSIILSAIWQTIRHDSERQYPGVLYCLIFLAISNVGETVVFTPAMFHTVFYWYVAVVALGLGSKKAHTVAVEDEAVSVPPALATARYPLLCRPDH